MNCSKLDIVFGSTTISLLGNSNIFLEEWLPQTPAWSGGGTYQSSIFGDGRRLIHRKRDYPIETFALYIREGSQDSAYRRLRQLQSILEAGANYWTTANQPTPAYLAVQSSQESNVRYALIMGYQIGELNNVFGRPFMQPGAKALLQFDLALERLHWTETAPGTGTAVEVASYQTFDNRTLGTTNFAGTVVPTSTAHVVHFSGQRTYNLSDIYFYDSSLTSFSSNLLDEVASYDLFQGVTPTAADIIYFGSDSSITNSGPFNNLILDITAATHTGVTLIWEYWNGAWSTLSPINDETNDFQNSGINSICWAQPSDWTTTSVNSVTGWWVRVRVSAVTTWTTNPEQQNRQIHIASWPFIEIEADQSPGDMMASSKIAVRQPGQPVNIKALFVGLRTVSRGTNFTAYLRASDSHNPSGLTVTETGTATAFTTASRASSGRIVVATNPTATLSDNVVNFIFSQSLVTHYYGVYRIFIRARTDDTTNAKMRLRVIDSLGTSYQNSQVLRFETTDLELVDAGIFQFPTGILTSVEGLPYGFRVEIGMDDASGTIDLWELVLIPVDEWAAEVASPTDKAIVHDMTTYIDGIDYPRVGGRATLYDHVNAEWAEVLLPKFSGQPSLQPNTLQRLWFVPQGNASSYNAYAYNNVFSIALERQAKYLTVRGDS